MHLTGKTLKLYWKQFVLEKGLKMISLFINCNSLRPTNSTIWRKMEIIKNFIDEIYSSAPEENYETNQTMIKSIDDNWSADSLVMNDSGSEKNGSYRYILVVIDNFGKFGWTIPLKDNYAQSMADAFLQSVNSSKRQPNLLETNDGKEYVHKTSSEFLNNSNIKTCSRKFTLAP